MNKIFDHMDKASVLMGQARLELVKARGETIGELIGELLKQSDELRKNIEPAEEEAAAAKKPKWAATYTTTVVSTAHLPEDLADAMRDEDGCVKDMIGDYSLMCYEKTNYGYRVWVDAEDDHIPEAIRPLILAARADGFTWVEFDCDVGEIEGFETWEW